VTIGGEMTQDLLQELFDYKDGNLTRKFAVGRCEVGDAIGTITQRGYIHAKINNKTYQAHRLIYIWHNGDIPEGLQIDHINGVKDDNRIENLRLVTNQENQFNTQAKGYYWDKPKSKFRTQITLDGKRIHIGYFNNENDARIAYEEAKSKVHQIQTH